MQHEDLLDADLAPSVAPEADTLDWDALRELSLRPGGFREERVALWPRLLNVNVSSPDSASADSASTLATENHIPADPAAHLLDGHAAPHPDERQVRLDTDRSFVLYPVEDTKEKEGRQKALHDLIVAVFRRRRRLSYFQGYHDIVSVLFLTLPAELQLPCVEKLSLHRVRDAMGTTLEPLVGLLRVLTRVLALADPEYAARLESHSPLPYYALSNLLTLFSHDMPTLPLIQHVFDYILCRPPIITVYLTAAVVLARKQEVGILEEEGEEGMIHSLLSCLPDLQDEYVEDAVNDVVKDEETSSIEEEEPDTPCTTDATENFECGTADVLESVAEKLPDDSLTSSLQTTRAGDGDSEETPQESTLSSSIPSEQDSSSNDMIDEPSHVSQPSAHTENTSTLEDSLEEPKPEPRARRKSISPPRARRPPIALAKLLERSDELYTLYPPSHPSIALSSIMGPQSVVFTWSENPSELPMDEEAELMVTQPQLVALPPPAEPETDMKDETEDEKDRPHKRHRRRLHKPRRLGAMVVERKTVVASAVLVLGVAMAIYGMQAAPEHRHGTASRELRRLSRVFGGLVVGAGERLWDGMVGMTG